MTDKDKLIVHKSNPLLNMKNDMGLYLQRLFNLYLAAINPLRADTKTVKFTLSEFVRLLDITEVSPKKLHGLAKEAVKMSVDLYAIEEEGGKKRSITNRMNYVNVWHRFKIDQDDSGEWIVELEAHEDVLPYMFDLKDLGYLDFPVIYALRMRSNIAEKLYEQCARYKKLKKFSISPEELKNRLGVAEKASYKSYNKLKTGLLTRCIKEINDNTDIFVEIIDEERMHTRGAPVSRITFSVEKNPKLKRQKPDAEIEVMGERSTPIDVQMTPVDVMSNQKCQDEALAGMLKEYELTDSEVKTVIQDQKKLGLSDDRVMEVVKYSIEQKPEEPIRYIRTMLKLKDADLRIISEEEKARGKQGIGNQFNQFEQNKYDFNRLEKELIDGNHFGKTAEDVPGNIAVGAEVQEEIKEVPYKSEKEPKKGLPLYYIVLGRSDTQDRLAAYASKGITEITILSEEDYNRLK